MKTKLLYTILCSVFMFCSCSDFFEVNDQELIDQELVAANDEFIVGLWSNLYNGLENGFSEVGNQMLASASDEAHSNVPFGSVTAFNKATWNSYNNPYNRSMQYLYQLNENACHFLNVSDTTKNQNFNFFQEYKMLPDGGFKYNTFLFNLKAYRIDARFFKAYYHFQLWRAYGSVAIVDDELTKEQALALQQASLNEMVDYLTTTLDEIILEFDELEEMPASTYTDGRWDSNGLGRITKGAAQALKCRMLLYAASPLHNNGTYNKDLCDRAARAAADIINSNVYSVNINYRAMQFDRTKSNPENILDNRTGVGNSNFFELWNYPQDGNAKYVNVNGICSNATSPSQNLAEAYDRLPGYDPATPFNNLDDRFRMTFICDGDIFNGGEVKSYHGAKAGIGEKNATATGYYLRKFVSENLELPAGTLAPHIWYVFRYSEVLLNYAEAMLNAWDATAYRGYITRGDMNALDAVNMVRLRAGHNANNQSLTMLDNDNLRRERQVELAFEGHRFWDVRRWQIAEQTEIKPLRGMYITYNSATGAKNYNPNYVVNKREFKKGMELFPIPYDEMHKYPSWNQNWW